MNKHNTLSQEYYQLILDFESLHSNLCLARNCRALWIEHRFYIDVDTNEQFKKFVLQQSAVTATPNPNRFIKSSFTLSLLWVAKFYRVLQSQSTTNTNDLFVNSLGKALGIDPNDDDRYQHACLYLHHSTKRCENLLAFILTGIPSSYHAVHFGFKSTARFINL